MEQPLISIVIPVYNQTTDVLRSTLGSVVSQTYKNIEILIIDDGSDADILSMIKDVKNHKIFYHKLEHKNANVARNYGIIKSKGKYIAMLDADDMWLENHLEDCLNTLKNADADGLYGSLILRNSASRAEQIVTVREPKKDETMIDYLLSHGYGAQTSTLFIQSETAKDILWNPNLNRHQDYDFVVRYSKKYKLIPKQTPTVIYTLGNNVANIDFISCMQFIKENENDISPDIYCKYHLNMLSLARQRNESEDIIKHYQKEATRCKEYLSYVQFLTLRQPQSQRDTVKLKLEYLFHILRIRTE
ncbi:hypothetical protein FACS18947_2060 [Bacteroidia bacterium]|nr:hypothetical protein FACS18947_2060 [Bacteroidia bacterium]